MFIMDQNTQSESAGQEAEAAREKRIRETGQVALEEGDDGNRIQLISIIGEIE